MNRTYFNTIIICVLCFFGGNINIACKKLIAIDEPINTITTTAVFNNDATALSAMAGVYSLMSSGYSSQTMTTFEIFSTGLSTQLGALSSDEFYYNGVGGPLYDIGINYVKSTPTNVPCGNFWNSAYDVIYKANSVIEGIAASKSVDLHENVRKELTGEAKFVRAFSYFYLTNFFGDVPMVLTVDFNKTKDLQRMPQTQVYQQIIRDLLDAQSALPTDYSAGHGERIIPNKWAATMLLARTYLYTRDYVNAAAQATAVISNMSLFNLETDLRYVFLTSSREAIWQLKQTDTNNTLKNATQEGLVFLPKPLTTGIAFYNLSNQLLSAFEPDDKRRTAWIGSTDNTYVPPGNPPVNPHVTYYPYKYTLGASNADAGQPQPQYNVVLRLAEAYLIRAEAETNGAGGGVSAATDDLSIIRRRAGLPGLSSGLSQQQLQIAVAKERQTELFIEWGHRWLDLKRTNQAHNTLSAIPLKQPWRGDYQLLYPIPREEILVDHFLIQNPGY